jgi:hypothetical protein
MTCRDEKNAGLWAGAVEEIRSIVARFPQRELDIRWHCAVDARFRSVCRDYEEAAAALRYWRTVASGHGSRIEEYESFLGELEAEIRAQLGSAQARDGSEAPGLEKAVREDRHKRRNHK